jgi:thioredoxin reductase
MIEVAIVGAGPYGLSTAAHLRNHGIPFRVFGRPMDSWKEHMPAGMMLKSDGFASNIYDPEKRFTLKQFCADRNIPYADMGLPVTLDTFSKYGVAFRDRMVPELEEKMVTSVERRGDHFALRLDDGEEFEARKVVLAVGITHFAHIPETLRHLPAELLSHSYSQADPSKFTNRSVVVVGTGSSAIDMAGLLRDNDADVQLVARGTALRFHTKPHATKPRSLWKRLRHPDSGLGPGLRTRFYSDLPGLFHHVPESLRLKVVYKTLGPSAGWFMRDKVMGRVPLVLGHRIEGAEVQNGKVLLKLRSLDGVPREVTTGFVIAATGYKPRIERLNFLAADIQSKIKNINNTPVLNSHFESSVPGLYFIGLSAANSFGPVMRFAFGAGYAAETVTDAMLKSLKRNPAAVPVRNVVSAAD